MATIGEVGPGSFDAYEGIRILIPGFIVFALGVATYATLAPNNGVDFLTNPVVGLVGSLVAGLILYFWGIPARAASYLENQPTDYLEKQFPNVTPSELLTTYFVALNEQMPAHIRNRSLYMGSMYRIGIETIIALGVGASAVFTVTLFDYGSVGSANTITAHRVAAAVMVVALFGSILVSRGYDRKNADRSRSALEAWRTIFADDLWHRSILIYVTGIVLVSAPNLPVIIEHAPGSLDRALAAAGLALSETYWLLRYVRGDLVDRERPRKRRKLRSPTAGLLFVVPLVLSLAFYDPQDRTVLPTVGHLAGWTAVAIVVIVSVVIRGHERKLHGVYRGQIRWLQKNPEKMRSMLSVTSGGAAEEAQEGSTAAGAGIVELHATISGLEILERRARRRRIRRFRHR